MANIITSPYFNKPQGYLCISDPDPNKSKGEVPLMEYVTITCGHEGHLVKVDLKAPEPPTELCYGCMRNICKKCAAEMHKTGKCKTIEQRLDEWEAVARFQKAVIG